MDDTEQDGGDRADEAARKKGAVDAYESEWYEVLKRRAAEVQEGSDAGEPERDDEG